MVARIVPFNHPLSFAARGLAGPLIAGNTVVIKPPETSSLSSHILGEIAKEIMPPGTREHRHRQRACRRATRSCAHPRVKRISFTGSIPTGMAIQRAAAEGGIKALTLGAGRQEPVHRLSGLRSRQGRRRRHRRHELRVVGTVLRLHQPADAA